MQPFLIVAEGVTTTELEKHFQGEVFPIWEKTWVVASSVYTTSADISDLHLPEKEDEPARARVIVRIGEYHGYFNPALWQKIEAWKEH